THRTYLPPDTDSEHTISRQHSQQLSRQASEQSYFAGRMNTAAAFHHNRHDVIDELPPLDLISDSVSIENLHKLTNEQQQAAADDDERSNVNDSHRHQVIITNNSSHLNSSATAAATLSYDNGSATAAAAASALQSQSQY